MVSFLVIWSFRKKYLKKNFSSVLKISSEILQIVFHFTSLPYCNHGNKYMAYSHSSSVRLESICYTFRTGLIFKFPDKKYWFICEREREIVSPGYCPNEASQQKKGRENTGTWNFWVPHELQGLNHWATFWCFLRALAGTGAEAEQPRLEAAFIWDDTISGGDVHYETQCQLQNGQVL